MILDTRRVNLQFRSPDWTCLPIAGVWSQVECEEPASLYLAQMDVDSAFYRLRCPAGTEEHFIMPPVGTWRSCARWLLTLPLDRPGVLAAPGC